MTVDKIILGAGLYGLYAALQCGRRGQRVLVFERDAAPFMRATYINQARVHMGYHYPRSYSTAIKSAHYFERFCKDYGFCLRTDFDQIYATSAHFSWTNAAEFRRFCRSAGIRCDGVRATGRAPTTFSVCFQFPDGKGGNITAVNGAASLADENFIGKYLEKTGIDGKTIALAAPEISLPARLFFIERCHAAGAFVAAAFSSEEMASGEVRGALPQIDLLSANIDEAAALAGSLL